MIGNIKKTNEILKKYNLRAKKGYGQNFLVDENVLKKIVSTANTTKEDGIIEIGPGIGALTEVLLENSKKVLAYEIDNYLVEVLNDVLSKYHNFKIINEDFLEANLEEDISYLDDCKRIVVVSNLPYYITTPIIFKLLSETNRVNEYVLMVQKEVGLRLTSKPNTKDYNALSVLMKYKTESSIAFEVSRNCFIPIPNVDSVIIYIKRKQSDLRVNNEANFLKFIETIFNQRRKTMVNNIINYYRFEKEKILEILNGLGYNPNIRSEVLSLEDIHRIYLRIFESPQD